MSFFGSLFGTDQAAQKVTNAQKTNIAQSQQTQQQNNELFQPYVQSGNQATGVQSDLLGLNGRGAQQTANANYSASPDFQQRFTTGLQALDRSNLGKYGSLANGNVLKSTEDYGQQQGALGYNDYYSKLAGLGSQGLNAATSNANSNQNANTAITNATTAAGNAQANASLQAGNIGLGILGLGTQLFAPQIRSAATSLFSPAPNPVATTGRPISVTGDSGSNYYW